METGYEDIDRLTTKQNEMLDSSLEQQRDIVNKQTEMNIAELEKNKQEIDKDVDKTNKALYAEYRKASNPYSSNAENLASQGLGNSGYAETTQTNLYNTYQRNITDTLNNARDLKSDFDFQINKARQTGDLTLAKNALEIYNQKMQLLTQEYELRNNREQFLYQKEQNALAQNNWEKEYAYQQERDKVSDNQWQQSFDYNKNRDQINDNQWQQTFDYNKNRDNISDNQWQQSFDYQKQRDSVSDSQWQKQYELSKKASASSSKRSSGSTSKSSKKSSSSSDGLVVNDKQQPEYSAKDVISKMTILQLPGNQGAVKDGISGKTFANVDKLLNYYGYAGVE